MPKGQVSQDSVHKVEGSLPCVVEGDLTAGNGRVWGESVWADLGGRAGCRLDQGQSFRKPRLTWAAVGFLLASGFVLGF